MKLYVKGKYERISFEKDGFEKIQCLTYKYVYHILHNIVHI